MLVIFDCDGTLIDSEVIASAIDAEALTRLGRPTTPAEFVERFTGVPHREIWRLLEAELGRPLPEGFLDEIREVSIRRFAEELTVIEGVHDAVAAIDGLGLKRCIASSTGLEGLRRNLATTNLLDSFDPHVFSASQCARGKPAPDVFLYAASQMGSDPADCLVIEDSVAGVTAARRANMPVLGFTGGGHADPGLAARLSAAGAAVVLSGMAELPRIVAAHFGV
ncbi:HAD family hydrolase [Prosthecomicrobium sp. N25]|uniref:HAD family hydrolase n=1 Tax=Prosthecomicrobium sp. N25 TaxID=3129254 RepID=UPI003076ABDD